MRWCVASGTLFLALVVGCWGCGPGRGMYPRRGPRKLIPLVFKQHVPNVPENTLTASGKAEGRIARNDSRFKDLVSNYNRDIIFKDEEYTGADRKMTQRCKEKLNTLAISVMNRWPGVRLLVTKGWDENGHHSADSLHNEGRAVDIATSDRDRSKLGMLASLAVEAGFDWVFYATRAHIHCSVKLESSVGLKYGGCFPGESTVATSTDTRRKLSDLQVGEKVLARDPTTGRLVYSEVILFLDYDPNQKREFLKFVLASGRTLTVTPNHLVLSGTSKDPRTVFAETIKAGDNLLVSDTGAIIYDTVMEVHEVLETGVYAPLTKLGTVVINEVVASCYATVDDQQLAHWAFLPLRFTWNVKRGFFRLWSVISKPIMIWSHDTHSVTSSYKQTTVGVHWYAKILYSTAQYIMPSHLHD